MGLQIAIAGAGLAGRLFAWALSRAGHAVQVFEAGPGPEPRFDGQGAAAFTAAGMLSPLAELDRAEAEVAALGWRSLQLWPQVCEALGVRSCLQTQGSLLLAHRQDLGAAERVLARLGEHPELGRAQSLSEAELQDLEPSLLRGPRAWLLPGEGLIHPPGLMAALQDQSPDVRWHWQSPVDALHAGELQLSSGARVAADWAIDCRGLGARPQVAGLRGVRGEVVHLSLSGHGLQRPLRLLHPRHRIYLVPRTPDSLVLGASEIESEDRSPVSLQSAVELMAAAHSVLPALAEARITRLDVNLRPALPDHRPLSLAEPGLLRLNGLYRHGWLLAPALVQQLLLHCGLASLAAHKESCTAPT
ncbi:FAD-dependent oxidoreductase [Paucibacter aquatile]|uniref:FAD-dependent oxidoreductase n=1 Tax=Kinneretia aquatilis TaxID=2070761 RepID=A0A2N8L2M9_9BURK|nr:FAD-dependent oxidoreductase [Paucibacter aquatile]PND39955.1 FAD-dependent oxidoreductase [Paucibacter aquatile]